MLYIPGFTFVAGSSSIKKGGSILKQQSEQKMMAADYVDFTPGERYNIYYIKKEDDKLIYQFKNLSTGQLIERKFTSVKEADLLIERLTGK